MYPSNLLPLSNVAELFSYYIPITDTTLELSVFWPSDTSGAGNYNNHAHPDTNMKLDRNGH